LWYKFDLNKQNKIWMNMKIQYYNKIRWDLAPLAPNDKPLLDKWIALVNPVLNFWVPWNAGKLSSAQTTRDLSSSAQLHRASYVISALWWILQQRFCIKIN
jgi:hypothetical protein